MLQSCIRLLTAVIGFFISALVFYALNLCFPVENMDQIDPVDLYGTFTEAEARRAGVAPLEEIHPDGLSEGRQSRDKDVTLQGEKEV
jgi:NCS1 family nucleobase:cation symporter-1